MSTRCFGGYVVSGIKAGAQYYFVKGARAYLEFNLPPVEYSSDKHLDYLYSWSYPYEGDVFGDEWADILSEARESGVPLLGEYEELLSKYGYLFWVYNDVETILGKYMGRRIDERLIDEIRANEWARRAYNPFVPLATASPQATAKPFEKLIILLSDGAATKPGNVKGTAKTRYDVLFHTDVRVEVKTTRMMKSSGGGMNKRLMAYGKAEKFKTRIEQVKPIYFDFLVMNVVASNVSLYAVFSSESIVELIWERFVEGEAIEGLSVSLQHKVKGTPREKDKRAKMLEDSEFIISFEGYKGLSSVLEWADLASFDVRDVVKYLKKKSQRNP